VISSHGKVLVEFYGGLAERGQEVEMGKDTRFDIASVNKSMIAALVLRAVEQGKLDWDEGVHDALERLGYENEFDEGMKLHHLLSHTSGLPDYDGADSALVANDFQGLRRMHVSRAEYIAFIDALEPLGGPGDQFYYSNFAYHLAAMLVEAAYEKPFPNVVQEQLSKPLGLKSVMSSLDNGEVIGELATGYMWDSQAAAWNKNPYIDLTVGRRVFATVRDLNRWAEVMDNPGYLSEASLQKMTTNHVGHLTSGVSYGYGWVTVDSENPTQMGQLPLEVPYLIHGGKTDGYKAMLININHGQYIISFLSNVGDRTNEMELATKLVELLNPTS
jgi:CubicO group peptidase (beta-lactamase class C family)